MKKNTKIFLFVFLSLFTTLFIFAPDTNAQGLQYQLLEKIPGTDNLGSDLPGYVKAIYKVALIVVTLSAVLMISIGGFMYLTSAGNTAAMGNAKGVITDALIGLVIALSAWLVLYVINPDLVNISMTALPPVAVTLPKESGTGGVGVTPPAACPTPPNTTAACCLPGVNCSACVGGGGCVPVTGVTNKGCGLSTCFLSPGLLAKLQRVSGVDGWRITESWPPTVNHISDCHKIGSCTDLNNIGGDTSPATIKKYYDAFKAAGLQVLYESKNCDAYLLAGVDNCRAYPTMTNGSSFHVN